MKKLLLLLIFIVITSSSFAQYKERKAISKYETAVSLTNITAYPNPFTESTKIRFTSTSKQTVKFSVINLLGKTIFYKTFEVKEGFNSFTFYRDEFAKGIYIYSIQCKDEVVSKRLIIR